jgi:hypothetical protein
MKWVNGSYENHVINSEPFWCIPPQKCRITRNFAVPFHNPTTVQTPYHSQQRPGSPERPERPEGPECTSERNHQDIRQIIIMFPLGEQQL